MGGKLHCGRLRGRGWNLAGWNGVLFGFEADLRALRRSLENAVACRLHG